MICRANKENNVVWFGSYGLDKEKPVYNKEGELIGYKAKFYNDKKESYSKNQEGVKDSLIQRLSILQNELWYRVNYGIPIFEKVHSKTLIDTHIASTIMDNPDVIRIESFSSQVVNRKYSCYIKIISIYGDFELSI